MTISYLLLLQTVPAATVAKIKSLAPKYRVVLKEEIKTPEQLDQVEILFGWEDETGIKLLNSPTSRLRWIQSYSAGVDDLDLRKIKEKNILLTSASGIHGIQITESVIGMLLAHTRGIRESIFAQTKSTWQKKIQVTELYGTSMLIVGTGSIGRQLASVATALGIKVYGINRSGYELENFCKTYPQKDIDIVLPDIDIVVNILPMTPETYHFYDSSRFSRMKDGVIFINVGRGASVNTNDLIQACHNNKFAFLGIDVFEEEPLPSNHPLWSMNNVLITPHISGKTSHYLERLMEIFEENLDNYQEHGTVIRSQVSLTQGY